MSKGPWVAFGIGMVIWLAYVGNQTQKSEDGRPHISVPPPTPPGPPMLKALFELLGLVFKIEAASASEGSVTMRNNPITESDIPFYPKDFVDKYKITTKIDVENFDRKSANDLKFCTKKANRETSNYLAFLQQRVSCLREKGYDSNDLAYMGEKLDVQRQ